MKKMWFFLYYWFPPIVIMLVIFGLSARQRVSVSETYIVNFIVFKTLHVLEYSVLYFFVFRAYYKTFTNIPLNKICLYAILTTFIYAATDEFHQSFTPTRQPTLRDVGIDTIGILLTFVYTKKYLAKLKWIL